MKSQEIKIKYWCKNNLMFEKTLQLIQDLLTKELTIIWANTWQVLKVISSTSPMKINIMKDMGLKIKSSKRKKWIIANMKTYLLARSDLSGKKIK